MASEGLRYPLEGAYTRRVTGGSHASSLTSSSPGFGHLVAVILKYPRREESGRRKSLNPGPIG